MADVQLAVNELGALAASLGRTSVSSAQVALALGGGRMPNLLETIRAKVGLPQNVEPSPRDVGTALRLLANATGLLEGYRGGHAKAASWRPVEAGKAVAAEAPPKAVEMPKVANVESPPVPTGKQSPERFVELLKHAKRNVKFPELCDRLDLSPRKCSALIEDAKGAGLYIDVAHDHVSFRVPEPDLETTPQVGPAPVVSGRSVIAVASDLHFGSRYTMREHIKDFIHIAYESGARQVFVPGDITDGVYPDRIHELSHYGLDEQTDDAIETLPRLPGLTFHAISGNHDARYTKTTGINVSDFIESRFRAKGRNDFFCYGPAQKMLMVGHTKVELWHPALMRANQYAGSYSTERHIDAGYALGSKPSILLVGHLHRFIKITRRGIHAVLCPCFQAPGSEFSKWLGHPPANGGLILSWETTADNTIRRFACEEISYYVPEVPEAMRS
jgi:predicted phosphodiesterase